MALRHRNLSRTGYWRLRGLSDCFLKYIRLDNTALVLLQIGVYVRLN